MRFERDERKFDFHKIGLAIKRAREASGMTQEQLVYLIDRTPRTILYKENNGQHPQLERVLPDGHDVWHLGGSVFLPAKNGESERRKHIDAMLDSLNGKDLKGVEA